MDINERLRLITKELFHGNKAAFARVAQVPSARAYDYLSARNYAAPPGRVLENLAKNLPQLNPKWLLTGEGEMIQNITTPEIPTTLVSLKEYQKKLEQMEARVEALRAQITLKDKLLAGLLRKMEKKAK